MGPPRCGQAVDDQIHLTEIRLDEVDHPRLHLVREGVTIEALCVQSCLFCQLVEACRVIPAGGTGLAVGARFLEEDANGRCAGTKSRGNAGGQSRNQ